MGVNGEGAAALCSLGTAIDFISAESPDAIDFISAEGAFPDLSAWRLLFTVVVMLRMLTSETQPASPDVDEDPCERAHARDRVKTCV
jgi:hypothetical protein